MFNAKLIYIQYAKLINVPCCSNLSQREILVQLVH